MVRKFLGSIFAIVAGAVECLSFTQISGTIRRCQPSFVALLFCLALLLTVGSVGAFAQSEPNLEIGFKPYGSYHGTGIDSLGLPPAAPPATAES